jgi:tripartite-type tricarboxylate transporter receptor subunit TctC
VPSAGAHLQISVKLQAKQRATFSSHLGWNAMKLPRRKFLHLAASAVAFPAMSRLAWAQAYPSRPVKFIVGFAPGSSPDTTVRLIAQSLSNRLGQQFIVENRPGAGTNIATEAVVWAPADGYTLLWIPATSAINVTLFEKLSFDFLRDIVPVAAVVRLPNGMLVTQSFPARSVPEFITYAKANPAKVNMAFSTNGGTDHLAGELFKRMAGIELVGVPYRGGGAALYTDLISGQVQVSFSAMAASVGYIRGDKLRLLAVTSAARWDRMSDVPSVSEFVPGYEATSWHGIGAPKGTPVDIVERLNKEVNAALAGAATKERFAELGGTAMGGSPADFARFIAAEAEKWGKVIRAANIKPE